jgi:transcriptional regulator with XRE-family HTH domain
MASVAGNYGGNPVTHFGRQVRKERLARGWSIHELARRMGVAAGHLSRIENGKRPPTQTIAAKCDDVFAERRGWFTEYYEESRTWTPPGFRDWQEHEDAATSLRAWMPGIVHGLLQTEEYARALLETAPGVTEEIVTARLAARMERQRRVLMRDDPPLVWLLVDQLSLYRLVGSAEIMAAQMGHLVAVAAMPNVTLQVLPAVAHPATASELIVTDSAAYAENVVGGYVFTEEETFTRLVRLFHTILSESYRASDSAAMIEEVGQIWTAGASPASQAPTADRV